MANKKSSGDVRHLDTKSFDRTISEYRGHIRRFNTIIRDVDQIVNRLSSNWQGRGRDAFAHDTKAIQRELVDMSEAMDKLSELLNSAHEAYKSADRDVGKEFRSAGTE